MKVAMVTPNFPAAAEAPAGGVEAAVLSLVRAMLLVQPDLDLHIIRCPAAQDGIAYRATDPPFTVHNVRALASGILMVPGFRPRRRIERLLARLQPDLVHVQAISCFLDGARHPAVLTVHGIWERNTLYRQVRLPHLRSRILGRLEAAGRTRYRHVIAIAGYVAQHLETQLTGRCHFIPNAIETEFYDHHRRESGPRILYSGSVIPGKNMHGLIAAVGLLARDGIDCRLRVAGAEATGAYALKVRGLIQEWQVADRIEFLGSLDRPTLIEEMEQARCLVLPSFQETLPMVVAEAGAMGIPQVVSPAGGSAEMIVPGYSGMLVDARCPASIAGGLRPLLMDPDLAATFGERARDQARIYRPEVIAGQTLTVYRTILDEPPCAS